ncbi:hypothetical protein FO519_000300 [Halicephalobus sp. NKZ332]|nr:hypothetical protein FO519_000300 [Halicephalobus sp. NKZ332]
MAERYLDVRARERTTTTRERGRTSSINFVPDFTGSDFFGVVFEDEEKAERRYTVLSSAMRSRAATMRSRLNTITSIVDGKEVEVVEELKTNWRSIYIATFVSMFNGIQFSVFFASLWPFLHTIDDNATSTFFGIVTASYCLMQTIFGPFYGIWMNKFGTTKYPLGTGIAIMGISNALYACVEMFPEHQRGYVMLVARSGVGMGSGCLGVTRAYAAMGSTLQDRTKAVTYMAASFVIGLTIGPGFQIAFTPIKDGFHIGSFHISEYTSPAIFAVIIDTISLFVLFTIFKEDYVGIVVTENNDDPYYVLPSFKKLPATICILTQFTQMFVVTNGEAIGSMYGMAMFDWTDEEATKYFAIIQAVSGISSLTVYFLFMFKYGERVGRGYERIAVISSLTMLLLYHIITYPFPFLPGKVDQRIVNNETVGCLSDYGWCNYTHQVNVWVYVLANVFIMSASFPMMTIFCSTIYSKILGNRPQGIMQSIQFMAGSFARTVGPFLMTTLFDKYGPEIIWGVEIIVLAMTLALWIIFYRQIVPLETHPVLKPGEYYKYNKGYKYRF